MRILLLSNRSFVCSCLLLIPWSFLDIGVKDKIKECWLEFDCFYGDQRWGLSNEKGENCNNWIGARYFSPSPTFPPHLFGPS